MQAADHLEAPFVQRDGRTDINDIYAFQSPDNPDNTVVVMTVNPLAGVASGTNFDKRAKYQFLVDTDGDRRQDEVFTVRFGKVRDDDHGLIAGSVARETWSIHPDDPLSARGACHWTDELERDGIRLRTEMRCSMWADAEAFHLNAKMEAYENDELVCEREETDVIARENL